MRTAHLTLVGIVFTTMFAFLGTYLTARANADAARATATATIAVARINAGATVTVARINAAVALRQPPDTSKTQRAP